MDGIERLEAIEAIKQLKARYFRTMDTKDWDGMRQVFTDDVVIDTTQDAGGDAIEGADVFMPFLVGHIEHVTTTHHGHMPEITITSPTTATAIWAMEDMLRWPDGGPMHTLHGYGHYHEDYEKVGGEWRIKTLTLTRLRVDIT